MKQLDKYLDIANSIKPDVNPETYDKDFGGSINEPISAGLSDFATASRNMNFRFKSLNEDVSTSIKDIDMNSVNINEDDYAPDDSFEMDNEDDFGKFLRGFNVYGKSSDDIKGDEEPKHKTVQLTMEDYADIDWNQSPDTLNKILGERTRKLLNERTIANNKESDHNVFKDTFGEDLETKIANNQIPENVYNAARGVITELVNNGIIEQYDTGLDNDVDFIKNKMIEQIFNDYSDRPSLRSKVETLLLSDLKSARGDISQLVDIYNKKH